MSAESGWIGTAIGISVGTFSWVVGLDRIVWPAHPLWALLLIMAPVSIISMALLERNERGTHRARS